MPSSVLTLGRGLFHTQPASVPAGTVGTLHWTTADFSSDPASGNDNITTALRLMISSGTGNNYSGSGTNYDVYEKGIGLAIPQNRIDISGWEAIRDADDYDATNAQIILFGEIGPAKKIIEEDCLAPFGLYMTTGNGGLITLHRPKNPEKYHICGNNNKLVVNVPASSTTYTGTMNVGVYNRSEMATEIARALNAVSSNFTASYSTVTNKMSVTHTGSTWDLDTGGANDGWPTMGFTSDQNAVADGVAATADTTSALFSGTTLTDNDVWDVRQIPSEDLRATSVMYLYDYVPERVVRDRFRRNDKLQTMDEAYTSQRWYISGEDVNLGGEMMEGVYVIRSKGQYSSDQTGGSAWSYMIEPSSGCAPSQQDPAAAGAADADSMNLLVPSMILDRYRQPPMRLLLKCMWKHNALEVGENIQLTYTTQNKIMDFELNSDTLTTRTFEIVRRSPNYRKGYIELELIGHRAPTTTSVSITTVGV